MRRVAPAAVCLVVCHVLVMTPGAAWSAPRPPAPLGLAGPSAKPRTPPVPKPAPHRRAQPPSTALPRADVPLPPVRPSEIARVPPGGAQPPAAAAAPAAAPAGQAAAPKAPAFPPPPEMSEEDFATCMKDIAEIGGEVRAADAAVVHDKARPECSVPGAVIFSKVKLEEGEVKLESEITIRCTLALALTHWVRDDLAPIVRRGDVKLVGLTSVGGQACRLRNGQATGPISEHASGNAMDVQGLKLSNGRVIDLTQSDGDTADIRMQVQKSTCARFFTVLGPGADSAHANHIHLDLRARKNDYRMCQWDVKSDG